MMQKVLVTNKNHSYY